MVIQRQWITSKQPNQISSSSEDDSTESWTNNARTKQQQVKPTPEAIYDAMLKDYQHRADVNAPKTLDLLRLNLQAAFDREIDAIVRKYKESYFLPAATNVKNNLGDSAVTDDDIQIAVQKMLEHSVNQYSSSISAKSSLSPSHTNSLFELSDSDSSSQDNSNTVALPLFNTTFQKSPFIATGSSCLKYGDSFHETASPSARKNASPGPLPDDDGGKRFDILHSTLTRPSRHKVTWNTSAITADTRFVSDVQANEWLNLGRTCDRITSKYPALIRYPPDSEDMAWLAAQKLMFSPARNNPYKPFLLVYDEVVKLKDCDWTSSTTTFEARELGSFKVSEGMVKKMHRYFTELSMKNQGIRTNSGYFDTVSLSRTDFAAKEEFGLSKPKSSLSSSHATLSALLGSGCTDSPDVV